MANPELLFMMRIFAQAVLIVSAVMAAGLWYQSPLSSCVVVSVVSAGLLCLISAVVSIIPIFLARQWRKELLTAACLGASATRLLLTLAGALLIRGLIIEPDQKMAFILWTMGFYMILLIWETVTVLRIVKKH